MPIEPKPTLAILLANWYSGATLLTILLNNHSKIISNGESFPFGWHDKTRYICSCGSYLDKCKFYTQIASHMKLPDNTWDHYLFSRLPHYSDISPINSLMNSVRLDSKARAFLIRKIFPLKQRQDKFALSHAQFFTKAIRHSNALIYLDATKSIRRAQLFAEYGFFNIKVINLVRDGRAFSYSFVKNEQLIPGKHEEPPSYKKAAMAWNNYIEMTDKLCRDYPKLNILDVRYEDLCANSTLVLEAIYKHLGLSFEPYDNNKQSESHILGHNMRKSFNGKISERKEWKLKLSKSDINLITKLCRDKLARYNYI